MEIDMGSGQDKGIAPAPGGATQPQGAPQPPGAVWEKAEAHIRELLCCGYHDRETLTECAEDRLVGDDGKRVVPYAQARRLVDRLWQERLAEQAAWESPTDPERLTRAFGDLVASGITARENFTCCRTCGNAEIGGERGEQDHGFVYFHTQSTESAAAGHGLMLLYGGYDGSEETTTAVGHEVVAALAAAGLSTEWTGSPRAAIRVTPLTWHKRLVG
jgi:hypothetical protein